ncbi:MAG: 30S ribosome-binding factor RbfA [Pseudomonadota bacterium]
MSHHRPDRVASQVHGELDRLLREEVHDPRVKTVSVTSVKLTPDLRRAVISVLPLGGAGDRSSVLRGLVAASGFLRGRIGRNLGLRYAPALVFEIDDHLEEAVRLTHLLGALELAEGGEE